MQDQVLKTIVQSGPASDSGGYNKIRCRAVRFSNFEFGLGFGFSDAKNRGFGFGFSLENQETC